MKKPLYPAVIFDMDGTILDTLEDLADSVNHVLTERGYPPRSLDEVRMLIGYGVRNLMTGALPEEVLASLPDEAGRDSLIDEVCADMREWYKAHADIKTKAYEGIPELLLALKKAGVRTAVVSNKPDAAVALLTPRYFPEMFDVARGEQQGVPRKPAPDGVLAILREWGIPPEKAVYVGDGDTDIETARNAGLDLIMVTWGFRDKTYLAARGAQVFCETPEELRQMLLGTPQERTTTDTDGQNREETDK